MKRRVKSRVFLVVALAQVLGKAANNSGKCMAHWELRAQVRVGR